MVSMIDTNSAAPPAWFTAALATPVTQRTTIVDGATIAYRTWGEPGGRGIVLVHGGAAHSCWWDHIGPLLADGRLVVALDLSGHGDSARRESYGLDQWAREVLAVADDAGIATPPSSVSRVATRVMVSSGGSQRTPSSMACGSSERSARIAANCNGSDNRPKSRLPSDR